jgi:predicted transposase YbfD/YdcC
MSSSLIEHFSKVKDPRVVNRCEHRLIDIIVIAVCATICRCDESWEQVEEFGNIKKDWFQKFLELPNGIPSHDTFRRVFLLINPVELQSSFFDWANSFRNILTGETIAIDGKASRGSRDIGLNKKAIYTVSAWAVENQLVLGQVKVAEKSNEITAIPKLLELLDVSGCTVTIDAMGTQKAIAKNIVDNDADYILGLKGNHGNFHDDVKTYINDQLDNQTSELKDETQQTKETADADHGRLEERKFHLFTDLDWLEQRLDWAGLSGIGVVESTVERNGKTSFERRFYITTLTCIEAFSKGVREHWSIENSLHHTLDVAFDEDRSTRKKGDSPANSAVLRHIALNLLKKEKSKKVSINRKRAMACLLPEYLEKIVFS